MSLMDFYQWWGKVRATILLLIIFTSIFFCVKGCCYTFDLEFKPPWGEADHLERSVKEKNEERAAQRFQKKEKERSAGEKSSKQDKKDRKKAKEYYSKHAA